MIPYHDPAYVPMGNTPPPPNWLMVTGVDGSASFRSTGDAVPAVLIGDGGNPSILPGTADADRLIETRRQMNAFLMTKDGIFGRDW